MPAPRQRRYCRRAICGALKDTSLNAPWSVTSGAIAHFFPHSIQSRGTENRRLDPVELQPISTDPTPVSTRISTLFAEPSKSRDRYPPAVDGKRD
jgi:hypothetical protein